MGVEGDAALVVGDLLLQADLAGLDPPDDLFELLLRGFVRQGRVDRAGACRCGRASCANSARCAG